MKKYEKLWWGISFLGGCGGSIRGGGVRFSEPKWGFCSRGFNRGITLAITKVSQSDARLWLSDLSGTNRVHKCGRDTPINAGIAGIALPTALAYHCL